MRNHAVESAIGLEIVRAFVLGRVSLEPSADIGDEMPISGLDIHFRNAAGVIRIAMRATAAAYQRVQITV